MPDEQNYAIPLRFRKMENSHIVFWIFKDISWCMGTSFAFFKYIGVAMIIPTLIISLVIAWRTRDLVSELCHNLAISVWIMANSYWMISEFFHFDALIITGKITFKYLALIPFSIGVLLLGYYYLWYKPRYKGPEETM